MISGQLTDSQSKPLPYANVFIKGTRTGITADIDGNYRLDVTKQLDSLKKITLVYAYIGFQKTQIAVDFEELKNIENRTINVQFKEAEIIEYVIYQRAPIHKRIWFKSKNIFRKK